MKLHFYNLGIIFFFFFQIRLKGFPALSYFVSKNYLL